MEGVVTDNVVVIHHQRPGIAICRENIQKAGNGGCEFVVVLPGQQFLAVLQSDQAGMLEGANYVLPELPWLVVLLVQ